WSGYTIYAESVIQALTRLERKDLIPKFNFNYLYATCLVFDASYKKRIKEVIKNAQSTDNNISNIKIQLYFFQIWKERLVHHLKNNLRIAASSKKDSKVF